MVRRALNFSFKTTAARIGDKDDAQDLGKDKDNSDRNAGAARESGKTKLSLNRRRWQRARRNTELRIPFVAENSIARLEDELGGHKGDQRNNDQREGEKTHRRSSIFAIGFGHHSQADNHQCDSAPAQRRNQFAEKNPAAQRNKNVDHARERIGDVERDIPKHVKPADETGDDEKNRPPHQRRRQAVDAGPRERAVRGGYLSLHRVSKGVPRQTHTRRSGQVAASDYQSRRPILHPLF